MDAQGLRKKLIESLQNYSPWDDEDRGAAERIVDFVSREPKCAHRETAAGHLTGSAWIVNERGSSALLLHHRKLGKWLQPGGHADGSLDLLAVAMREAAEETGLKTLVPKDGCLFDVDVHEIPARKSESAHLHFDLRYVIRANDGEPLMGNDESRDLRWVALAELDLYTQERSVLRMRDKWVASLT